MDKQFEKKLLEADLFELAFCLNLKRSEVE